MKKIISTLLIILIFSCAGESNSEVKKEIKFVGFYDRLGAVEFVNDIPVDTILNPNFRQTKYFSDDGTQHMWMNNAKGPDGAPWISGTGIYGEAHIKNDTITEIIKYNFGGRAPIWLAPIDTLKKYWHSVDEKTKTMVWKSPIVYKDENSFSQLGGVEGNRRLSEYYVKVVGAKKTELDGVWIRKGTINYVNNIPVDTIPNDDEKNFQVKIYDKGKVMFLAKDLTIDDSSLQGFYGGGMYGNFTYENGVLSEIIDYGTFGNEQFHKNWPNKNEKGESVISFDVDLKENTYSQAWPTAKVYQDLGFGATAEYYERLK